MGSLTRIGVRKAAVGSTEQPELTVEEFERLQATARTIELLTEAVAPGTEAADQLADRSLEGIFPSVSDHRMSRYLFGIRNQMPPPRVHLNESAVFEALKSFKPAGFEAVRGPDEKYPVQLRVREP